MTLALFFASGFAGLVYEVLWLKELGLLFGNTAHAAATTFAAFFAGLAAGGAVWGRRVAGTTSPLRAYALLEGGVALSALAYFGLLAAYRVLYAPLFGLVGDDRALFIAVKFVLAVVILFPPAFFMGGTLPAISQQLVRGPRGLGRTVPLAYAVNTLGAALGAYAAGFHLPPLLGFRQTYLLAILLTLATALGAWWLARAGGPPAPPLRAARRDAPFPAPGPRPGPALIRLLALLSGFVTLSLEVLWTRMFGQVLQNSVYTYSAILVTFLVCLTLGAALAALLARGPWRPPAILFLLLGMSALLVGLSPFVFTWATGGLAYTGGEQAWAGYVLSVFGSAALVMLAPGLLLGTVFPYLMKLSEPFSRSTGRTVGDLAAVNTVGAIAGALAAGFLLLELVGLWSSIRLMAALYCLAAFWVGSAGGLTRVLAARAAAVAALVVLATLLDSSRLPLVRVDATDRRERLLEVWEGSAATVAVVEDERSRRIKMNNYYTLGGTASRTWEAWQSHLALLLHPSPRSVFFLGMGTGITAGAALAHPVERVLVSELVPEAVEASRKHFAPYTNGLFEDPRVRVVIEDGRTYLAGSRERFDVIVADLFMPWKAGTGTLYSREHYRAARGRLHARGLFAQWLPLYQMSRAEFGIIARTMLEVFPLVTLWRADFFSEGPAIALVGHRSAVPLDPTALSRRLAKASPERIGDLPLLHFVPDAASLVERRPADPARFLLYYGGNLTAAHRLVAGFAVNTDDRPLIEYRAPVNQRRQEARQTSWFVGAELIDFLDELLRTVPPDRDPYLAAMSERDRAHVRAGFDLHRLQVLEMAGAEADARQALTGFAEVLFGD